MADSQKSLSISKTDAARRQAETAIRLYFNVDEPVSIHTLTAASYNILRDLSIHTNAGRMFSKDLAFDFLTEEGKQLWKQRMNEAENFFKHADRDPEEVLPFDPELSELLLWEVCTQYTRITGEATPLMKLYNAWFFLGHRNLFNLPATFNNKIDPLLCFGDGIPRERFLAEILPRYTSASGG